ncbi:hypothetical protein U0070_026470 [Myodes glareolus]|uniref:thioredoxin-dependent peroxiredoxin n=1 Tax=Myodes glareolus TaxID=447135 RepID=A0AAW0JKU1_MYOGA
MKLSDGKTSLWSRNNSSAPHAWTEDITKKDHVEQFLKGERKQKGQAAARSSGLMSEVVLSGNQQLVVASIVLLTVLVSHNFQSRPKLLKESTDSRQRPFTCTAKKPTALESPMTRMIINDDVGLEKIPNLQRETRFDLSVVLAVMSSSNTHMESQPLTSRLRIAPLRKSSFWTKKVSPVYWLDFNFMYPTEFITFSNHTRTPKSWAKTPMKEGTWGPLNISLLADVTKSSFLNYGMLRNYEGIACRGIFIIDVKSVQIIEETVSELKLHYRQKHWCKTSYGTKDTEDPEIDLCSKDTQS